MISEGRILQISAKRQGNTGADDASAGKFEISNFFVAHDVLISSLLVIRCRH